MIMFDELTKETRYLLSARAIRDRARLIYDEGVSGELSAFEINPGRLKFTRDYVLKEINANYPDGNIPFHSRRRHFEVGAKDRIRMFDDDMPKISDLERLKRHIELNIVSVLLDAGAGAQWRYQEQLTGKAFGRSEGLGVATFHMYKQGFFSHYREHPLQVTGERLLNLKLDQLGEAFQVKPDNELVGLGGRFELMHRLGQCLSAEEFFGSNHRLGNIADSFVAASGDEGLPASAILQILLVALGPIWLHSMEWDGHPLGDAWTYSRWSDKKLFEQIVPFHKLSQWLSYSLMEPLQEYGVTVTGLDELTGLPEYRNGGLFVDCDVLQLKDSEKAHHFHKPESDLVIEWRALTICLLDELAAQIRESLGRSPEDLPLVKILQGGTWSAGRKIAKEKRATGAPPLQIASDGTVF